MPSRVANNNINKRVRPGARSRYLRGTRASGTENLKKLTVRLGLIDLAGASQAINKVRERIATLAGFDLPVLITGEPWTGKGSAARLIHAHSNRSAGPFIEVLCEQLAQDPDELLSDELPPATIKTSSRQSLLEQARGGTLYLRDLEKLPPDIQSRLLQYLDRRFAHPGPGPLDVRVIASTSADLCREVKEDRFNPGLCHAFIDTNIHLPPLCERDDDLLTIAMLYIDKFKAGMRTTVRSLSPEAVRAFQQYSWPRNLLELRNAIEGAMVFEIGDQITPTFLPPALFKECDHSGGIKSSIRLEDGESLMQYLDRHGLEVARMIIAECGGNKTRASRRLGFTRSGLGNWMKRATERLGQANGESVCGED